MIILVTGHLGFVGSTTVKLLKKSGHVVIGYDLMGGRDVRDMEQFDAVVENYGPDRILHLAAIARFADSDRDPVLAFETNVQGTINVVEVAGKRHVPLVFSSTGSAIMPLNDFPAPYSEDIPPRGNSIYGCTKALGELVVRRHTPYIILRYAHIYGKEKRGHGLVGGFVERIERGLAPVLYGGQQSNDFVYINDVARANVLALEASWDRWDQTYNVGTGVELTAAEAGRLVCKYAGYDGEVDVQAPRTVDNKRFVFDTAKAKAMLGFDAEYTFEDGLMDMFS